MNNVSKELIITMVKRIDETDYRFLRQLYTIIKCHFLRTRDALKEGEKMA